MLELEGSILHSVAGEELSNKMTFLQKSEEVRE